MVTPARISKYIESKNVRIDPKKCLSQPLVIFKNKLTRFEYVGQLMLNNQINTKSIPFLEKCDSRFNERIFHIQNKVYRFLRYKLVKKERLSTDMGVSKKIIERDKVARSLKHRTNETINLIDIREISVMPPRIQETPMTQIMTGLVGHTMYNATEDQSSIKSLSRLIEYNIADKQTDEQYTQHLLPEDPGYIESGLDMDDVFQVGDIIGEGTTGIITGLIHGADGIVTETGKLAHDVVHEAGGILGDITSSLSGPLLKILLPIGIALAIGLAVYLVVRYMMSNREGSKTPVIVSTTSHENEEFNHEMSSPKDNSFLRQRN